MSGPRCQRPNALLDTGRSARRGGSESEGPAARLPKSGGSKEARRGKRGFPSCFLNRAFFLGLGGFYRRNPHRRRRRPHDQQSLVKAESVTNHVDEYNALTQRKWRRNISRAWVGLTSHDRADRLPLSHS